MSFNRVQDEKRENENIEVRKCRSDLYFFKQIVFEKCRRVIINKNPFGFLKCEEASQNYIKQLEKCRDLPNFEFK